jgi:hypothetical protein
MTHQTRQISGYHSGDTMRLRCTVQDEDGDVVDIRDADITFALAQNQTSSSVIFTKDNIGGGGVTITDGVNGKFLVEIEPSDTASLDGTFPYEIEIVDTDGDVATVLTGSLVVAADLIA